MKANYKMTVAALASIALCGLAMMLSGIAMALVQDTVRCKLAPGGSVGMG